MKRTFFGLVLSLFVIMSANSFAATSVAIIKINEIISKSVAMQKAKKEIDKKKEQIEKDLKEKEKKLMNEKADFESQAKVLDRMVLEEKALKFQEKVIKFQEEVRQNEQLLASVNNNVIGQILDNIKKIIADIKKEGKHDFDIVIPADIAIHHDSKLDISGDVMVRLDKEYKEVKVDFTNKSK
ncbi:MAG: OmpH family outer membrane protein [Rickettsiales bacterium]|jgi:Skp family chaperone for outer membrane proteins|nr:OmpH family outer membrane protein [Rickettsiales bacterium]